MRNHLRNQSTVSILYGALFSHVDALSGSVVNSFKHCRSCLSHPVRAGDTEPWQKFASGDQFLVCDKTSYNGESDLGDC